MSHCQIWIIYSWSFTHPPPPYTRCLIYQVLFRQEISLNYKISSNKIAAFKFTVRNLLKRTIKVKTTAETTIHCLTFQTPLLAKVRHSPLYFSSRDFHGKIHFCGTSVNLNIPFNKRKLEMLTNEVTSLIPHYKQSLCKVHHLQRVWKSNSGISWATKWSRFLFYLRQSKTRMVLE